MMDEINETVDHEIDNEDAESGKDNVCSYERAKTEGSIHGRSHMHERPYVGQEFDSLDSVYEFYNSYALSKGFSVRKGHQYTSRNTKNVIKKTYVCSKEGVKDLRAKRRRGQDVRRRPNVREGCRAKLDVSYRGVGVWIVKAFCDEHSHLLVSCPSRKVELWSHRKLPCTSESKDTVNELHSFGVMNNTSKDRSVEITPQKYHTMLGAGRKNNMNREWVKVINYFQGKIAMDPDFYYAIEVDEDQTLRSFFWADGRARLSYLHFGDSMSFDVSYRTNATFHFPFAPVIGINHHMQSTLFGCALLADESEDTFVWLFEQWLKCMWGKAPVTIVTDQDPAIYNAIKRVFPRTRHRFCTWHLNKHENEKLKLLHPSRSEFAKDYRMWLGCKTIQQSEQGWESLKQKYSKFVSGWLEEMYEHRRHWVPAHLRDMFLGGMKSNHKSESINVFFKGFINSKTPLYEFVEQYEKALTYHRENEKKADHASMVTKPILRTRHRFEEQVSERYTRKVFELFQSNFSFFVACVHEKVKEDQSVVIYKVWLNSEKETKCFEVAYDTFEGNVRVKCSCGKFERKGILCAHCLYVLNKKKLPFIPDQYIISRYTMGARYTAPTCVVARSCPEVTTTMSWSLRAKAMKLVSASLGNINLFQKLDDVLSLLCEEFKAGQEVDSVLMGGKESQIGSTRNLNQLFGSVPDVSIRDAKIAKF